MIYIPFGIAVLISLYLFRQTKMPKHRLRDRFRELPEEKDDERVNQFEPGGKLHHLVSPKEKNSGRS